MASAAPARRPSRTVASNVRSSGAVAVPSQRSVAASRSPSITHNVGHTRFGKRSTNEAFDSFSVSMVSHTKSLASGASERSVSTYARMLWHE